LPLKQDVLGNTGTFLWVIMGGVGLVLLIACANVANLLLVRTESRQRELALRAALGATRSRVASQLLRESVVLGVLGGICGFGLACAALRLVAAFPPIGLPRIEEIAISPRVLYFTVGITLLTNFLFGLIPALRYSDVTAGALEGAHVAGLSRDRHRARNFLVTTQIALAVVLLICAGLMIRTFRGLSYVDPGFVRPPSFRRFALQFLIPMSPMMGASLGSSSKFRTNSLRFPVFPQSPLQVPFRWIKTLGLITCSPKTALTSRDQLLHSGIWCSLRPDTSRLWAYPSLPVGI